MTPRPEVGQTFEVRPFPFVRHVASIMGDDDYEDVHCWKPGVNDINQASQDDQWYEYQAHGLGALRLTVVATIKPGRFPWRVFYTRMWIDPDGKEFGKQNCRVATLQTFRKLCAGYAKEYVVVAAPVEEAVSA